MDQATNLRKMMKAEYKRTRKAEKNKTSPPPSTGKPRIIAVSSGKGGVGKTNVVGNLAVACQRMGKRVLIFDADLGLANIDIIYGLHPKHTILDTVSGKKGLSQIIVRGPEDVAVIPANSGVEELAQLTEGQKMHLLNEFDSLSSMFDILLIDIAAGISSNVIYFNLAAEERIIVVSPEPTSLTDAYALMKILFRQYGAKHFFLLANMVRGEAEGKLVYENVSGVMGRFMGGISLEYAGFIPRDNLLPKAVSNRRPVICQYPKGAASMGFVNLADFLLKQTSIQPLDGNIKFFFKRLIDAAKTIDYEGGN
jgi:flagellar biosynthesis protein FlhG